MRSRGKQMDSSTCRSSCVKLYLCSNPKDSVVERRALRESAIPKFREHCRHTVGLDVKVIDPFESSDPSRWPDENIRRQLIKECRESSAGPFLLALVGHQYGEADLPSQVEVSEFQLLLQEAQQAGVSTRELERVYQRDENSIPPSYCLRPAHAHTCCPQAEVKEDEDELRRVFQSSVSLSVHSGLMIPERARSYYRSALDADLRFALENRPDDDIVRRCLVYVHKVINAKGASSKTQIDAQPQSEAAASDLKTSPTDEQLFSELCDSFLPALITSSQLLVYTTTTECDRRHGYTTARRWGYTESLCQQVYTDLVGMTDCVNVSETRGDSQLGDALVRETAEQEELCDVMSEFYDVTRPEEEKVRAYVEQSEQRCPLVVTGGPCTGKAVLLAHCAQQIRTWLQDCDPVVITYFCNSSINPSSKHLLSSLCHQIAGRYHSRPQLNHSDSDDPGSITKLEDQNPTCEPDTREHVSDHNQHFGTLQCPDHPGKMGPDICLSELKERLSSLLSVMPSSKRPLVLILDGLDHTENDSGPQIVGSLPSPLPPNVRIILTVSINRTQILRAINPQRSPPHCVSESSKEESGYVCLPLGPVDRKQCVKMLASLLSCSGRRVTSGQQVLVNQALTSCCLPLYAQLLHAHTSLWHSDSDVTESSLPHGVHSSIFALLDHLEQKHGSSLVARAASYLTLSRTGLTEAELADLLSCDDKVLSEYVRVHRSSDGPPPSVMRVPQIDVETLLLDLRRFLMRRMVAGLHVLSWVSRHFGLVVAKKYLGSHEGRVEIHLAMVDYFSDRWAWGCAKPLLDNQTSSPNKNSAQMKIDRQASSQPFIFDSSSEEASRVNLRKVLELPYHLQQSGKWEEFERGLMMFWGFQQVMVRAGLLTDLVAMLAGEEESPHSSFSRERALIANILKSRACVLQSSPLHLPALMETSLLPYVEVFPELEGYVRQIRQERRERGSGLGVALCPAPSSVPSSQCLKCNSKTKGACVTEVAATECGIVAEIMDDGTAWMWKGSGCQVLQLLLSCEQQELKFAGVKSSSQFMLLSTQCNKLFLWDLTGPERFVHLTETPSDVEGFVACQKKLFIWWRGESSVSLFEGENMIHFQCKSCVTCVVCSSNGFYVYCGQEDGTVSIFDTDTGGLLGSGSNSNHNAVTLMMLCEDKWELACVDRTGNVTLWDVAAETKPPKLVRESFTGDKSNSILNTDYSGEINTLLVCQSHQVTLWDACEWELWDQFLAPQGRAFSQAVLYQEGHLFLALLHPLVLVWRVSTGECILSLETKQLAFKLLKTASDVISIAEDGSLTVWASEAIGAAAAAPKMRCGVREVAVEQTGEWFYTADGSERVWRWAFETGLPHAIFPHEGPVDKLRLSPDSTHLVTLSAGEIYVWQTETGQNILRMSGSRATDILITPTSNFGVSISERQLSRVWKLAQGSIVCSIHLYLSDAQVSPESTFLIGLRHGDLLAASLWSGSISKRFSCVASSENVVAFHTLSAHPDFVMVMAASGAVYTWKIAEETVCRHFLLPYTFHCQPQVFQMSPDGSYALLSTDDQAVKLLDLTQVRLCSFKAEAPVRKACLDKTGCYAAYVSAPESSCVHGWQVLTVVRLADGERIGSVCLYNNPLTLVVSEQCVFVGFEDGSVGVYSIVDDGEEPVRCRDHLLGQLKQCPFDRAPISWLPLPTPNIKWP